MCLYVHILCICYVVLEEIIIAYYCQSNTRRTHPSAGISNS